MTEAEWLACADPGPMLDFLRGQAGERKLRLYAAACGRRVWHLLNDRRSQKALAVAEAHADGRATGQDLAAAHAAAGDAAKEGEEDAAVTPASVEAAQAVFEATCPDALDAARGASALALRAMGHPGAAARLAGGEYLCDLLRDVFGPLPFHPVAIPGSVLAWDDGLVLRLAQAVYDDRRWRNMLVLGDALRDAGCREAAVLAHCRSGGEHVRGCWVLDLVRAVD
jgi:hypothetical protein